jgi:hypothetical protein
MGRDATARSIPRVCTVAPSQRLGVCRPLRPTGWRLALSPGRAGAAGPPAGCSGSRPPDKPRTDRRSRRTTPDSDGSPGARARPDHAAARLDPEVPGLCSDPRWDPLGGADCRWLHHRDRPEQLQGSCCNGSQVQTAGGDFALNATEAHAAGEIWHAPPDGQLRPHPGACRASPVVLQRPHI